jgi:hypothetical protein
VFFAPESEEARISREMMGRWRRNAGYRGNEEGLWKDMKSGRTKEERRKKEGRYVRISSSHFQEASTACKPMNLRVGSHRLWAYKLYVSRDSKKKKQVKNIAAC